MVISHTEVAMLVFTNQTPLIRRCL